MIQFIILVLGCATICLLASKKHQRWGFAIGLVSEPFWLWSALANGQWGIVLLVVWYTISYAIGLKNHWRRHG